MATFPKAFSFLLLILSIFLLSEGLQQQGHEERLQQCQQRCQQQHQERPSQLEQCRQRCQEEYMREKGHEGKGQEEREEGQFVFHKERFVQRLSTEHGSVRVLPKFFQLSRLLAGVSNYRVSVLNLKPRAFLKPHHLDAEVLLFVVKGHGSVGVVDSESRNSHDLREGDIFSVRAGSIWYLANKDNNERLTIVKLLHPVSQPGQFKEFFAVGLKRPYLQYFSKEITEAAFNLRPEELEELIGQRQQQQQQQQQGAIIKASEQQIRSIGGSEGGSSHPSREARRPFNLLRKRPTHSGNRGRLIEADRNDYQPLRDWDIQVSYANITQKSMLGPFFNTESYKIGVVTQGQGTVEIVCPHLASQRETREGEQEESEKRTGEEEQEQEQREPSYERVRSRVSEGTVLVFPPGHASVEIASSNQNLELVCFETNAERNQRIYLAGPNNPWRRMEDAVKELTFGTKSRTVDERLSRQKETVILPGPDERQRQDPLSSITDIFVF